MGVIKTKPYRLDVQLAGGSLEISMSTLAPESASFFVGVLERAVEEAHRTASVDATSSVADELAKLAALRDQGVLSDSEFEAKKASLLAYM